MRETAKFRIEKREELFKEQEGKCGYCREEIKGKPSLDHIIPLVLCTEDDNHEDNYIVTCPKCNKNKADYIIFCNLFDREFYPVIDVPYFFRLDYIQRNKPKTKRGSK